MANDVALVGDTVDRLLAEGFEVWLAGGWAEELHGMIRPRAHHDIDLLLRADTFDGVDAWMARSDVTEIVAKRFAHKRAFEVQDTMVELILVSPNLTTEFWGAHHYAWPDDTFDDRGRPPLVSRGALRHYRTNRPVNPTR